MQHRDREREQLKQRSKNRREMFKKGKGGMSAASHITHTNDETKLLNLNSVIQSHVTRERVKMNPKTK